MALPKRIAEYPNVTTPVAASIEELRALDPELLRRVASCSQPNTGNKGCPAYHLCDLPWKEQGARNIAYRQFKAGTVREIAGHCMAFITNRETRELNGDFVELIPGDTYMQSNSRQRHEKRDPECHYCMSGKAPCPLREEDPIEKRVEPLPTLEQHPQLMRYAIARKQRERLLEKQRADRRADAYNEPREGTTIAGGEAAQPARSAAGAGPHRVNQPLRKPTT